MKKVRIGLIAALLAIAASAFTSIQRSKSDRLVSYYWFQYDANGIIIEPSVAPSLGADPFGCSGSLHNCASGFLNYSPDGAKFKPVGAIQQTDLKN